MDQQLDKSTSQLARSLQASEPHPEQWVVQREARQTILNAIEKLPPGQRAAIVMRYYLDMSMAEMSAETERPLSTIKWWLRDARRRLRRLVESIPGKLE